MLPHFLRDKFSEWIGRGALAYRRRAIHKNILRGGVRHAFCEHEGVEYSYYYRIANRPPLILLHGFLDSSHTWRRLFARLGEHFDIYAIDLPGFGRSEYPPVRELWHMSSIARGLDRFLFDDSGLGLKDATVLTHSLGGLVALHMALQIKYMNLPPHGRMRELHLIAPGVLKQPVQKRDQTRRHLFPESEAEVRSLLSKLYSGMPPELWRPVIRGLLHEWSHPGYHYLAENTIEEEERVWFTPADLRKLRMPLTLYWGEQDQITELAMARKIKRGAPKTRLEIFEGAGHALHLERSLELVEAFLKNTTALQS
ncbi:MAG: alpha/beta hydrolase [bacterium]|nr:alpha/beta hydrolase [bacterium]